MRKGVAMKVEVDEELCIGSMACETTCPEVFQVVGGISQVQVEVVPPEVEDRCREAVDACPVQAIRIAEQ
jgi:ferredoxin